MKIDKKILDISRNMLTKSYDKLSIEQPDPRDGIYKTIFMFDISYYFDTLERLLKSSDIDDDEFEELDHIRLAYNILNIAGHYRHYFYRKLRTHNVVIMYASNRDHYNNYSKVFEMVNKLSILFKKIIFIEQLSESGNIHRPYIYNHIAYYTLQKIISMNQVIGIKSIVVWLGKSIVDYQYLNMQLNDCYNVSIKQISEGYDILFNDKFLSKNKPDHRIFNENSWEFREILPFIIALLGGRGGPNSRIDEYIGKRRKSIIDKLLDYITMNINELTASTFEKTFFTKSESRNMFQVRLQQTDVHRNSDIRSIVDKLIKIWESKLNTESTYSLNDIFEFKDETTLKVDWLMEF